jgi:hypothetical protein
MSMPVSWMAAARTLLLATSLGCILVALTAFLIDSDMPKALEIIGAVEKIAPLNADFLMTKANFLSYSGKIEESLAEQAHAAQLDPGNPSIFRFWMVNLFAAHRPADALRVAQTFDARFPGRIDRGALERIRAAAL